MTRIPEDLLYTSSHEWLEIEADLARIGITDYAQSELSDLVYAEAVPVGSVVKTGDAIGVVESVKVASDVLAPVSGEVVESNDSLGSQPEQINEDPYKIWFVVIRMDNPDGVSDLMDVGAYGELCRRLEQA